MAGLESLITADAVLGIVVLQLLEARLSLRRRGQYVRQLGEAVVHLAEQHPSVDADQIEEDLEDARSGPTAIERVIGD